MEGIGPIFGPSGWIGPSGLNIVLCVHKDEELVYIRNPESAYGCVYSYRPGGINEHSKNNLLVYPNPVTEKLTIKNDEFKITHLQMVDIWGRTIVELIPQGESQITVDMSAFISGIYLIHANVNGSIITEKIVKF